MASSTDDAVAALLEAKDRVATYRAVALAAGTSCAAAQSALASYASTHTDTTTACVALTGLLRTGGRGIVLAWAPNADERAKAFEGTPERTVVAVGKAGCEKSDAEAAAQLVWTAQHEAARPLLRGDCSDAEAAQNVLMTGELNGISAENGKPVPRAHIAHNVAVNVSFASTMSSASSSSSSLQAKASAPSAATASSTTAAAKKAPASAASKKKKAAPAARRKEADLNSFFSAAPPTSTKQQQQEHTEEKKQDEQSKRRVLRHDDSDESDESQDSDDEREAKLLERDAERIRREEEEVRNEVQDLLFGDQQSEEDEGNESAEHEQEKDKEQGTPHIEATVPPVEAAAAAPEVKTEQQKPRMVLGKDGYYVMVKPTAATPAATQTTEQQPKTQPEPKLKTEPEPAPATKKGGNGTASGGRKRGSTQPTQAPANKKKKPQPPQPSISSFFTALP